MSSQENKPPRSPRKAKGRRKRKLVLGPPRRPIRRERAKPFFQPYANIPRAIAHGRAYDVLKKGILKGLAEWREDILAFKTQPTDSEIFSLGILLGNFFYDEEIYKQCQLIWTTLGTMGYVSQDPIPEDSPLRAENLWSGDEPT